MTRAAHPTTSAAPPLVREDSLVRVYVWQWPVRIAHWVIFFSIVVLSLTGYYMYNPYIISRSESAFLMAKIRFTHEVTAAVFIAALLFRFYWFFKGYGWSRWTGFVSRKSWWRRGLVRQLKYYLFLRRGPHSQIGHNPLAALTYIVVYALMVVEVLTGLALFNHVVHSAVLGFFIGWLPLMISVPYLLQIHFLIMYAFLAFVIHHVYSATLVGIEERSGLMAGMFSGYKFFRAKCAATDPVEPAYVQTVLAVPAGSAAQARKAETPGGKPDPSAAPPSRK